MANFRRRRPRGRTWDSLRGSDTSWRAKYGLKPARLPEDWFTYEGDAYESLWHPRGRHGNRGYKISGPFSQMNMVPAWWVRSFLTKPYRAKMKLLVHRVKTGRRDADDTSWPPVKRSQSYYW